MVTGVTLGVGVITGLFSPIKFQADKGVLLAFMFVWNMVGALVLLPALTYFLLPAARRLDRVATAEPTTLKKGAEQVTGDRPLLLDTATC